MVYKKLTTILQLDKRNKLTFDICMYVLFTLSMPSVLCYIKTTLEKCSRNGCDYLKACHTSNVFALL